MFILIRCEACGFTGWYKKYPGECVVCGSLDYTAIDYEDMDDECKDFYDLMNDKEDED